MMRRVFIIRKDLHLKPGKLAAMVSHCAEAYWLNLLKAGCIKDNEFVMLPAVNYVAGESTGPALYKHPVLMKMSEEAYNAGKTSFITHAEDSRKTVTVKIEVSKDIWNEYVNGIFTKTVCECRNKSQLEKAKSIAESLGLVEGADWGFIRDCCKTDLVPENPDGTCTVGIWFKPLPDDIAHAISKKFQLYRDEFGNDAQHNG